MGHPDDLKPKVPNQFQIHHKRATIFPAEVRLRGLS